MAKRRARAKSAQFAQWVRAARAELGTTQKSLATKADIRQQDWSSIEKLGVIPDDDALGRLCLVLNKPKVEAEEIIRGTQSVDEHVNFFQKDWMLFRDTLNKREDGPSGTPLKKPVKLFVIREDKVPVDDVVVQMHLELIKPTNDLEITTLFRYGDNKDREQESFQWLASSLAKEWKGERIDLEQRFVGYYRHPDFQDDRSSIPMSHPVILLFDSSGVNLYNYAVHDKVFDRQKQIGHLSSDARRQAFVIIPSNTVVAENFAAWVGFRSFTELDDEKWQKIEWGASQNEIQRKSSNPDGVLPE